MWCTMKEYKVIQDYVENLQTKLNIFSHENWELIDLNIRSDQVWFVATFEREKM